MPTTFDHLPFTTRNFFTRPTPSAPRRALVPGEYRFTLRVPRARRAPGRALPCLLLLMGWWPAWGSHCARPTRAFPGRALREHRSPNRPSSSHPSPYLHLALKGSCQTILHCAHGTSTVSSCAFCEQEGWSGSSPSPLTEVPPSWL